MSNDFITCTQLAEKLISDVNKSVNFLVEGCDGWHYVASLANIFDSDVLLIGYWGDHVGAFAMHDAYDVAEVADAIQSYLTTYGENVNTLCLDVLPSEPINKLVRPVDMCNVRHGYTMKQIAERFAISHEIKNVVNDVVIMGDYDCWLKLRGGYSIGLTVDNGTLYKDGQPYKTIAELMK